MIVYHGFPLGVGEPLYAGLCRGCRPETRVRAYMEYFETACVPPKNFAGASERHNAVQEEVPWA